MNDMQHQASQLRQVLTQPFSTAPLLMLASQLGVYESLANMDNGTRALILFLAFIEKYGEVLEQQRVAHEELHQ